MRSGRRCHTVPWPASRSSCEAGRNYGNEAGTTGAGRTNVRAGIGVDGMWRGSCSRCAFAMYDDFGVLGLGQIHLYVCLHARKCFDHIWKILGGRREASLGGGCEKSSCGGAQHPLTTGRLDPLQPMKGTPMSVEMSGLLVAVHGTMGTHLKSEEK